MCELHPSIEWSQEQLYEYGIDVEELSVLIRHLERVRDKLSKMGLRLYVDGTQNVNVTHPDRPTHGPGPACRPNYESVVASVNIPGIDGGDW